MVPELNKNSTKWGQTRPKRGQTTLNNKTLLNNYFKQVKTELL